MTGHRDRVLVAVPIAPEPDELDDVTAYLLGVLVDQHVTDVVDAHPHPVRLRDLTRLRAEARRLFLQQAHTPPGQDADVDHLRATGRGDTS